MLLQGAVRSFNLLDVRVMLLLLPRLLVPCELFLTWSPTVSKLIVLSFTLNMCFGHDEISQREAVSGSNHRFAEWFGPKVCHVLPHC